MKLSIEQWTLLYKGSAHAIVWLPDEALQRIYKQLSMDYPGITLQDLDILINKGIGGRQHIEFDDSSIIIDDSEGDNEVKHIGKPTHNIYGRVSLEYCHKRGKYFLKAINMLFKPLEGEASET